MNRIVDWLIRRAKRTPYIHLNHADGTPYMERYWLLQTRFFAVRLHKICSADYDRHMHDHPWTFVSVVLRGGYVEKRPVLPDEFDLSLILWNPDGSERLAPETERRRWSIARRRYWHRHLITRVQPDTWTLFISGPKRQPWGFYTQDGFVPWREYPTCHAAGQVPQ